MNCFLFRCGCVCVCLLFVFHFSGRRNMCAESSLFVRLESWEAHKALQGVVERVIEFRIQSILFIDGCMCAYATLDECVCVFVSGVIEFLGDILMDSRNADESCSPKKR